MIYCTFSSDILFPSLYYLCKVSIEFTVVATNSSYGREQVPYPQPQIFPPSVPALEPLSSPAITQKGFFSLLRAHRAAGSKTPEMFTFFRYIDIILHISAIYERKTQPIQFIFPSGPFAVCLVTTAHTGAPVKEALATQNPEVLIQFRQNFCKEK